MKQVLFLILIVTLFSDLLALICSSSQKAICRDFTIKNCSCFPKAYDPPFYYAVVTVCNAPKHPVCLGNSNSLTCKCAS